MVTTVGWMARAVWLWKPSGSRLWVSADYSHDLQAVPGVGPKTGDFWMVRVHRGRRAGPSGA
jgi:hypothetical protein